MRSVPAGGPIVHSASRSGVATPPGPGSWRRCAAALVTLLAAGAAPAAEPLCDALAGLGSAAEALRRGDAAAGLSTARATWSAHPRGPIGAQAAATLGLALLRSHRPDEALEPLQAALVTPPLGLEGELWLALGRAFLDTGRPAEALEPLARAAAPGTGPAPRDARWLEAEALLGAGFVGPASLQLEVLLASPGGGSLARHGRLLLAEARRLAGRKAEALAAYRALAIEEADGPEGTEAVAALQAWAASGFDGARLTGEDRLRRAERLLQRGRAAESLAEAELAAAEAPAALDATAALVRGLALAGLDRLAEAAEVARLAAGSGDAGVRRGSQWLLARAASRAGRTEEAISRHLAVAGSNALVPGLGERRSRDLSDESAYLAAWLRYEAGDWKAAIARLDLFVRAHPGSPRADDARWFAAWSSLRAGDLRGGQARLARLETGPLAEAALYWQGRLGGASARARDRLRRAAQMGGDGWYGWLARRRLEGLGAAPPPWPSVELEMGGRPDDASAPGLRGAAALFALGARAAGVEALEALAHRASTRATAVEACRLATLAGEPALALRLARDRLGQARATERWLYPSAFQPMVSEAAQAAGVDEALLLALLRRESAFRPEARSAAGAIGLGQLLPRTAERLGLLATPSTELVSRLADPAANLPLAALYLGLLRDRFGSDAGALAAYNAGPAAPSTWSRPGAVQPLDEWVENVPYKETRNYLKTVLASREVYRRLAGLPPGLDPAAPIAAPVAGVAF